MAATRDSRTIVADARSQQEASSCSRRGADDESVTEIDLLERTQVGVAPIPRTRGEVGGQSLDRRADGGLVETGEARNRSPDVRVEIGLGSPPVRPEEAVGAVVRYETCPDMPERLGSHAEVTAGRRSRPPPPRGSRAGGLLGAGVFHIGHLNVPPPVHSEAHPHAALSVSP